MTNLDDKLREILQSPHQDSLGGTVMSFPTAKTLAQIKQAFEEAGYMRNVPQVEVVTRYEHGKKAAGLDKEEQL